MSQPGRRLLTAFSIRAGQSWSRAVVVAHIGRPLRASGSRSSSTAKNNGGEPCGHRRSCQS